MKTSILAAGLILVLGIGTECRADTKGRELAKGTEEFTEILKECYLAQDVMAAAYTESLEALDEYASDPGEEKRLQTATLLTEAYETVDQTELSFFEFPEEAEAFMEKQGLSVSEFEALSSVGQTDRHRYLEDLDWDLYFLECFAGAEEIPEEFQIEYEYKLQIQRELNLYMYYATNEILAALGEDELAYVKEEMFGQLTAFYPDDAKWQENPEDALQKQEECWTRIEAIQAKLEAETGRLRTE